MSDRNEFVFNGAIVEKDADGTTHDVLNQDDVFTNDSALDVVKNEGKVEIKSTLGLKLVDGLICVSVEE